MTWRLNILLAAVALAAAGCVDPNDPTINSKAAHALGPWQDLFDGKSLAGWMPVQGKAHVADGAMRLDGRAGKATVLLKAKPFTDGMVAFEVHRREGTDGPYTFGLRCGGGLAWRSIYVVCYPNQVGACQGTATRRQPQLAKTGKIIPTTCAEPWRVVLDGKRVEVYRFGRKVLDYKDPSPKPGTIAITADRCVLDVRSVRYLHLTPPPAATAPADGL